jgi:hypothetical protein
MKYKKENREEFFEYFEYIDKLTDEDKYTECLKALESIPIEERDYKVYYQMARAYQNFAIDCR